MLRSLVGSEMCIRDRRHITFGEYTPSYDAGDALAREELWSLLPIELRGKEEWPSEEWNFQDNYIPRSMREQALLSQQSAEIVELGLEDSGGSENELPQLTESELVEFFSSVKGIGKVMANNIVESLGTQGCICLLYTSPSPRDS